jgi:hypothetical protein
LSYTDAEQKREREKGVELGVKKKRKKGGIDGKLRRGSSNCAFAWLACISLLQWPGKKRGKNAW